MFVRWRGLSHNCCLHGQIWLFELHKARSSLWMRAHVSQYIGNNLRIFETKKMSSFLCICCLLTCSDLQFSLSWGKIFHGRKNLEPRPASFAPTRCSFICCSETREKHQQFWGPRLKISFVSRRKHDLLVLMVGKRRKPPTTEGNISYITGLNLQVDGSLGRFSLALVSWEVRVLRCWVKIRGTRPPTCCYSL